MNATGSGEQANNARLKRLLADTMLDNVVLKDLPGMEAAIPPLMKWMAPASGIAMCHIGCRVITNDGSHP